jgi:hypothetical protein
MREQTNPVAHSDEAVLNTMLAASKQLSARNDAFLQAQYDHLTARIQALIELQGCLPGRSVATDFGD